MTTARKGRRSKSRDLLKNNAATSISGTTSNQNARLNKEISIDITLDMQDSSETTGVTTSTATPNSSSTFLDSESKRPPIRRISGGWADTGPSVLKSSKSKKGSYEE